MEQGLKKAFALSYAHYLQPWIFLGYENYCICKKVRVRLGFVYLCLGQNSSAGEHVKEKTYPYILNKIGIIGDLGNARYESKISRDP